MSTPTTPPPVRAVARVGVSQSIAGPWRLLRYRSRRRVGPFRVEQLVMLELVGIGVLAVLGRPLWQVTAAGAGGPLLLVVAFAGSAGRGGVERGGPRSRHPPRPA